MSDIKIVRWNSEIGKLGKDTAPARIHIFDAAKMRYSAQALGQLAEFLKPFIPRLAANKGIATLAVQIAYQDVDFLAPGPPELTQNLKKIIADLEKQLQPKEFAAVHSWQPDATVSIRTSLDLPCPNCKANPGQHCDQADAMIHTYGNGLDKDSRIKIHDERARLMTAYVNMCK